MSQEQFEAFFAEADTDSSGSLTKSELVTKLKAAGYKGSDADIEALFKNCDTSGDGLVSKQEYLVAMGCVPEKDHKSAMLRRLFRDFDKNGDGTINREELKQVFKELGKSFTDDELQRMIGLGDKDGSGTLDYEEFIKQVFG